jgi:hypothetical protein
MILRTRLWRGDTTVTDGAYLSEILYAGAIFILVQSTDAVVNGGLCRRRSGPPRTAVLWRRTVDQLGLVGRQHLAAGQGSSFSPVGRGQLERRRSTSSCRTC